MALRVCREETTDQQAAFQECLPDFEFILAEGQDTQDLLEELKIERAFTSISALIDQGGCRAYTENVVEKTE